MRPACQDFAAKHLPTLAGCRVVEVGSLCVNGSIRGTAQAKGCGEYIGVDLQEGQGVDLVGDARRLGELVGEGSAGLVVSVDTLEHVEDWRTVVSEMKRTCAPGGLILLTAAPVGFQRHEYPGDYWRFDLATLRAIFADCEEVAADEDIPAILARKPEGFEEMDLTDVILPEAPKR